MVGIGLSVGLARHRRRRSAGAGVLPMPIISRGLPIYESGGFYAPANATDADYSSYWRSVTPPTTTPQRIAIDLSSVPNTQKTSTVLAWYNFTGTYYLTDAQSSGNYSSEPRDYTIQVHTGAGGGAAPAIGDAGWTTAATVTGNTKSSRQHGLNLSGINWLQLRFTAGNGPTGVNDDIVLQFDIFDISAGNQDNWLFLGDSITAEGFALRNISGDPWTNGPLASLIHAAYPASYPLVQNGGLPAQRIDYADTNKATLLAGFTGKYVAISFGTNDASAPTVATTYTSALLSLIDYVIGMGCIPVVPKIPKRTDSTIPDGYIQQYNTAIEQVYIDRPSVIRGPDLYAKVNDGTIPLRDGIHPTYAGAGNGYEQMMVAWRDALLVNVYGAAPPVQAQNGMLDFSDSNNSGYVVLFGI